MTLSPMTLSPITSGYLHARPDTLSGLKLDEGIFR